MSNKLRLFLPNHTILLQRKSNDNCGAQNKNNYVLWYLLYQTYILKKYQKITLNFLIQGHTKFSCDRHFGTAKMALKKAYNIETFGEVLTVIIIKGSSENAKVVPLRNPDA